MFSKLPCLNDQQEKNSPGKNAAWQRALFMFCETLPCTELMLQDYGQNEARNSCAPDALGMQDDSQDTYLQGYISYTRKNVMPSNSRD